eukprot:7768691-Pyramimonas_sp.AAC.1
MRPVGPLMRSGSELSKTEVFTFSLWRQTPADECAAARDNPIKPYLDPVLRQPRHMEAPTRKLHAAGTLPLRRRARCFVGAFT